MCMMHSRLASFIYSLPACTLPNRSQVHNSHTKLIACSISRGHSVVIMQHNYCLHQHEEGSCHMANMVHVFYYSQLSTANVSHLQLTGCSSTPSINLDLVVLQWRPWQHRPAVGEGSRVCHLQLNSRGPCPLQCCHKIPPAQCTDLYTVSRNCHCHVVAV